MPRLLLYALAAEADMPRGLVGVGGAEVVGIEVAEGLVAYASEAPAPGVLARPAVEAVLAFERAVAALFARQTVVPLRFGTAVEGEDEARRLVGSQAEAHRATLARLDGLAEVALRGPLPPSVDASAPPPAARAPSGTAYLRRRRAAHAAAHARDEAAREAVVRRYVRPHEAVRDHAWRVGERREDASEGAARQWTLAVLLPRDAVAAYRAAVHQHAEAAGDDLSVTGPWPPYSFV
jgi:hypothetical protein